MNKVRYYISQAGGVCVGVCVCVCAGVVCVVYVHLVCVCIDIGMYVRRRVACV